MWATEADWRVAAAAFIAVAAIFFGPPASAAEADAGAGQRKAAKCQTCHGLDGLARLPHAPHIAGQNQIYLIKALKDYRSGVRRDDMMTLVSRELSDQDILDLAAYYGRIEFRVKAP
jgi:cytochrome c553